LVKPDLDCFDIFGGGILVENILTEKLIFEN